MELERETLIEIAVSVAGVGLFVVALFLISLLYADGGLSSTGALALVGVMVLFILLMTGVGYWLSGREA